MNDGIYSICTPSVAGASPSGYTQALNTNQTLYAQNFRVPKGGGTLTDVYFYVTAVSGGTLQEGDIRCDIYDTATGSTIKPNSSIGYTTQCEQLPSGAAWVHMIFDPGISLTEYETYHVVLKCPNASTKYVTVGFPGLIVPFGDVRLQYLSTDNGSSWSATEARHGIGVKVGGRFITIPCSNTISYANRVYGTLKYGVIIKTPTTIDLVVERIGSYGALDSGTPPTGYRLAVLDANNNIIAQSKPDLHASDCNKRFYAAFIFDPPVILRRNTIFKVAAYHPSGSGDASNCTNFPYYCFTTIDDTNLRKDAFPWNGYGYLISATSGWSFTETKTAIPLINFYGRMLDGVSPQIAQGGFPLVSVPQGL